MNLKTDDRENVDRGDLISALNLLSKAIKCRLREKGFYAWHSSHEILGVVTEEYNEVIDEVHNNDNRALVCELTDLAVACIHGIASIVGGKVHW